MNCGWKDKYTVKKSRKKGLYSYLKTIFLKMSLRHINIMVVTARRMNMQERSLL